MFLSYFAATFSGLGVPMWLLILAKTLNTFSSLALLMDQLGDTSSFEEYLRSELNKLCLAFAGIGGVALVSGTCYVR